MTTIFAPITSVGASAISVVRISGEDALSCLEKFGVKKNIQANQIKFTKIYDVENNDLIDEVVIAYFQAPHSFTGQDIVEISFHSSIYIAKKITNILSKIKNFRFAEAGEFSKIAFLNGKIDLVQAEAIVDLIKSETEMQHRQALKQLSGELGKIYDKWRYQIIEILALIESFIDFPDEDLPQNLVDEINKKNFLLKEEIKNHLNDNKVGQKIKDGLSLAIIGSPNVGKSSLLNYLAKSEVAIVSDIAGTTRDVIEIHLDIAGIAVKIADTAGIRDSIDPIEQEGIKRALTKAENSDLKILMFDQDSQDIKFSDDKNTIKVLNKIDLIKSDFDKNNQFDVVISLKEKNNLDLLIKKIEEKILEILPNQNQNFITQERYRIALNKALENLENFSFEKNIELAAEDLRLAAYNISQITGRIDVENILDVIFSKFCIGK